MNYQIKHQELRQEIIDKLLAIKDRPEGWLPHVVYVQDENCDSGDPDAHLYNQYQLLDYLDTGECQLLCSEGSVEAGGLCEIETEGLITILNWYGELTGIPMEAEEPKELQAVIFPIDFGRNISDSKLIALYNDNCEDITVYSPDKFAAIVNDEAYDDTNTYVRFLKL